MSHEETDAVMPPYDEEILNAAPPRCERRSGRRIAFFIYALTGGGAQRRALTLANGFAGRGYDVDVVVVRGRGLLNGELSPRARLVALDADWSAWHLGEITRKRSLKGYMAVPSLARYLSRERPDILLSAASHANIPAILAWHLAGKPSRLVLRASNHPSGNLRHRPLSYRLFKPLYNRLGGILYAHADAVIAVSKGVADAVAELTGMPREQISTVYNPMTRPGGGMTTDNAGSGPAPHPWLEPGHPPVILGAGRFAIQKDFATLVRAFASLRQHRPARLIILGDGPRRPELEALVRQMGMEQDVLLPGYVYDAPRWMARAGVFVLSSLWEGLPGVLIEALSVGCPIVSVDCPSGPREILEDGRYGTLVPAREPESMAGAIAAMLGAPLSPELLRSRAAEFSLDRGILNYLEILERLMPRPLSRMAAQ
jgi:glycosyltransferase involved in cell wall biosynthesis